MFVSISSSSNLKNIFYSLRFVGMSMFLIQYMNFQFRYLFDMWLALSVNSMSREMIVCSCIDVIVALKKYIDLIKKLFFNS